MYSVEGLSLLPGREPMVDVREADRLVRELGASRLLNYRELNLAAYISDDSSVIAERQHIFGDLMACDEAYEMLSSALERLCVIDELEKHIQPSEDNETCLYSVKEVELYCELIDMLNEYASLTNGKLHSEYLKRFCSEVQKIAAGEACVRLRQTVRELTCSVNGVKSITLGINLNASLMPYEAGIVSVNTEYYRSGDLLSRFLRMELSDAQMHTVAPLSAVNNKLTNTEREVLRISLNAALQKILGKSLHSFRRLTKAYFSEGVRSFLPLLDELRFIKCGMETIRELRERKLPLCFPRVDDKTARSFDVRGLYNPTVKVEPGARPILNGLRFDEEGQIYILTGPNQGGKSVLLRAVGIAQLLFQLGLPIPARTATLSPVDGLLLHFPSQDGHAGNGRFADECERMRTIMQRVGRYCLVLCDESFSGSAASESAEIAREVICAMSIIGCRAIFSTHLHSLAEDIKRINRSPEVISRVDSLVMQLENGRPTYNVMRCAPEGHSYANIIAEKYGLSCEAILKNKESKCVL